MLHFVYELKSLKLERGQIPSPAILRHSDYEAGKGGDIYTHLGEIQARRANVFSPADESAPHGYIHERPRLGRYSPRINGSVDYLGPHRLAVIIDDS